MPARGPLCESHHVRRQSRNPTYCPARSKPEKGYIFLGTLEKRLHGEPRINDLRAKNCELRRIKKYYVNQFRTPCHPVSSPSLLPGGTLTRVLSVLRRAHSVQCWRGNSLKLQATDLPAPEKREAG